MSRFPNHMNVFAIFVLVLTSCASNPALEVPTVTVLPTGTKLPSESDQIQQRISQPQGAGAVAFGSGSIWVAHRVEYHVLRMDMDTGETVDSPIELNFEPGEIAYGEEAVWVCSADHTRLAKIDPKTSEVIVEIDLRSLQIPDHVLLLLAAGEG